MKEARSALWPTVRSVPTIITVCAWGLLFIVAIGPTVLMDHNDLVLDNRDLKRGMVEPPDSLRRRSKAITEEVEIFKRVRRDGHPPYSTGMEDVPAEQQKINWASDAYDAETESICAVKFQGRFAGIAREMRGKGLDVQWLDSSVHPCPNDQDISIMRELSFHLDGTNNVVRF